MQFNQLKQHQEILIKKSFLIADLFICKRKAQLTTHRDFHEYFEANTFKIIIENNR